MWDMHQPSSWSTAGFWIQDIIHAALRHDASVPAIAQDQGAPGEGLAEPARCLGLPNAHLVDAHTMIACLVAIMEWAGTSCACSVSPSLPMRDYSTSEE